MPQLPTDIFRRCLPSLLPTEYIHQYLIKNFKIFTIHTTNIDKPTDIVSVITVKEYGRIHKKLVKSWMDPVIWPGTSVQCKKWCLSLSLSLSLSLAMTRHIRRTNGIAECHASYPFHTMIKLSLEFINSFSTFHSKYIFFIVLYLL
jgi:hypothetical protein